MSKISKSLENYEKKFRKECFEFFGEEDIKLKHPLFDAFYTYVDTIHREYNANKDPDVSGIKIIPKSDLKSEDIILMIINFQEDFREECFEFFDKKITPEHPLYKAFLLYIEAKKSRKKYYKF